MPNRLVIRLQPDEGVKLELMIKDPGPGGMRLQQVPVDMSFKEVFNVRNPDAYERLLMDVVRGNQTLFMRRDEVAAAWNWVDPDSRITGSSSHDMPKPYTSGTWGPASSVALIERDGHTWHESRPRDRRAQRHLTIARPSRRRWRTVWPVALSRAISTQGRSDAGCFRRQHTSPVLRAPRPAKPSPGDKVMVTLVDERQVTETSPRSNARLVKQRLLQDNASDGPLRAAVRQ